MNKPYLIDNEPVNGSELIDRAKDYGYKGDRDGIYYTSSAANILRKHGYVVEKNSNEITKVGKRIL